MFITIQGLVTLEAGNDTITDSDHSLHTGHIALFQGFSLEGMYVYICAASIKPVIFYRHQRFNWISIYVPSVV